MAVLMVSHTIRFGAVIAPTMAILISQWWPKTANSTIYREVFGDKHCYLEFDYPINPNGALQQGGLRREIKFSGSIVLGNDEDPLTGTRQQINGKRIYQFVTSSGLLVQADLLGSSDHRCEPHLFIRVFRNQKLVHKATLRAGFCF